MEFEKIVTGVDFNYEDDKDEFKRGDRIVRLNRFIDEDGQDVLGMTFNLGCKEDDSMSLILPFGEFVTKIESLTVIKS